MNTDWMHGLVDNIREAQHEQSILLHNLGNLCGQLVVQQKRIIELLEMAAANTTGQPMASGLNLNKLLQWPMLPYLIAGGLLMANFKAPEIAEFLKLFAAIQ